VAYFASKVASAVNFAMAELMGQAATNTDPDDIDADGEYEMDDVEYAPGPAIEVMPDADGHTTDAEGSDVDAEGEDVDAEGEEVDDDEDEAEPVGAVKIATRRSRSSDEEEDYEGDDVARDSSDAKSSDSDESSNADSEEENQWQASEGGEEDEVIKSSNPNVCM
jgi:histone acetyltransferase SAS3